MTELDIDGVPKLTEEHLAEYLRAWGHGGVCVKCGWIEESKMLRATEGVVTPKKHARRRYTLPIRCPACGGSDCWIQCDPQTDTEVLLLSDGSTVATGR